MSYTRYAIYFMPAGDALAQFGARWLGWDVASGQAVEQFAIPGLGEATQTPRKYGFHATLKAPFRLAGGETQDGLEQAVADLANQTAVARCSGLTPARLGRFVALIPDGDDTDLKRLCGACVTGLDGFRAPLTEAEIARRNPDRLSARQRDLLLSWGYPHVLDQFRFHMTLTGRMPAAHVANWVETVRQIMPELPHPFILDRIGLAGERRDGRFELIRHFPLGNSEAL